MYSYVKLRLINLEANVVSLFKFEKAKNEALVFLNLEPVKAISCSNGASYLSTSENASTCAKMDHKAVKHTSAKVAKAQVRAGKYRKPCRTLPNLLQDGFRALDQ